MKYVLTYEVEINGKWRRRKDKLFDFGTSRAQIRNECQHLSHCWDVRNVMVNGIPLELIMECLNKAPEKTHTGLGRVIRSVIDGEKIVISKNKQLI